MHDLEGQGEKVDLKDQQILLKTKRIKNNKNGKREGDRGRGLIILNNNLRSRDILKSLIILRKYSMIKETVKTK